MKSPQRRPEPLLLRVSACRAAASVTSIISCSMTSLKALSFSGRFMMMVSTAPSCSTSRCWKSFRIGVSYYYIWGSLGGICRLKSDHYKLNHLAIQGDQPPRYLHRCPPSESPHHVQLIPTEGAACPSPVADVGTNRAER